MPWPSSQSASRDAESEAESVWLQGKGSRENCYRGWLPRLPPKARSSCTRNPAVLQKFGPANSPILWPIRHAHIERLVEEFIQVKANANAITGPTALWRARERGGQRVLHLQGTLAGYDAGTTRSGLRSAGNPCPDTALDSVWMPAMGASASLDNPCELAGPLSRPGPPWGASHLPLSHLFISIMLLLRARACVQGESLCCSLFMEQDTPPTARTSHTHFPGPRSRGPHRQAVLSPETWTAAGSPS